MIKLILLSLIITNIYSQSQQFLSDSQRQIYKKEFDKFLSNHGKFYQEQEYENRLNNFIQNMEELNQLNQKYDGKTQFGINKFSDMTKDEFRNSVLMRSTVLQGSGENLKGNFAPLLQINQDLPVNFDWKNSTTPVKDQGSCGSCWAFSVAQDIESRWFLATGQQKNLSIQQILECDPYDDACYGGWTYNGFQYVIDNGGIQDESSYPYNVANHVICLKNQTFNLTCPVAPDDPPCTLFCDLTCKENQAQKAAHISGYFRIPQNEDQMKQQLYEKGPYSIALDADGLQSYSGGIYKGGWFGCGDTINHAVLLVGYGTESGTDYWLVKNSWGESWGEKGYFRIQRGNNMCNITSYPMFSIVENQEVYQLSLI